MSWPVNPRVGDMAAGAGPKCCTVKVCRDRIALHIARSLRIVGKQSKIDRAVGVGKGHRQASAFALGDMVRHMRDDDASKSCHGSGACCKYAISAIGYALP